MNLYPNDIKISVLTNCWIVEQGDRLPVMYTTSELDKLLEDLKNRLKK